jgi:hypothetical protein
VYAFEPLLAAVLLTAPGGWVDVDAIHSLPAGLRGPLQSMAVRLEILDPREVRYILARPDDFHADLKILRRRYLDLANAPAIDDCFRFPDRAVVNDLLAFNRAYRQHIDVRQPVELIHWWELRLALEETEHLYQVWDAVRDARCEYYYVHVRRQALKRLREQIGDQAYYGGDLPPCVPLWRFQAAD